MQTSQRRRIQEIAQRLAEGTASPQAAQELRNLLEDLAQDSDFESLPELTQFIRQYLEAGPLEVGGRRPPTSEIIEPESKVGGYRPPPSEIIEPEPKVVGRRPIPSETAAAQPEPKGKPAYTLPRAVIIGGAALAVLVVVFLATRLLLPPAGPRGTSDQRPLAQEPTAVVAESEESTPAVHADATPAQARPTQAIPAGATPTRRNLTPSPAPTLSRQAYTILACVGWQDAPEVGLPGFTISLATTADASTPDEIDISNEDGCVEFPISVLPGTQIELRAEPSGDQMQIVAGAESLAWETIEEDGALALVATLGEESSTDYTARFLVVSQRTFSGEVLDRVGVGIPGAEVQLQGRSGAGEDWIPNSQTATTKADGTFVLTDTTGLSEVFYRIAISNTIANSYVYTTTSVSGPDANWIAGQDPGTPSVAWVETQTALGSDQLSVGNVVFNQDLEYIVFWVQDAILEPAGLEWETVSPASGQDETLSYLIAMDQSTIDSLQARWEDIELPPGTYALEIWTPETSSARVSYQILSSGQILDERVSYQSTRQERGEVNQWIDFSKTLNPSLVIELPISEKVSIVAKPSLSTTNREYNLSGNVVFGVGPVRFVKQ